MKFKNMNKYNNKRNWSKNLVSVALLNSLFLTNIILSVSLASSFSEDGRYETFEGENIKVSDILEESKVDIGLEGKTLVNRLDYSPTYGFSSMAGTVDASNYIEINANGINYMNYFIDKNNLSVKPNTTYTFVLDIAENSLVRSDGNPAAFVFGESSNQWEPSYWNEQWWIACGTVGMQKFTLTTKSSFDNVMVGDRGFVTCDVSGKLKFRYMIIEGDYTNIDLEYFRGIKSLGEDNVNGHNVKIKSSNKNLFDFNKLESVNDTYHNPFNGVNHTDKTITFDGIYDDTYMLSGASGFNAAPIEERRFLIKVKPNTNYTISFNKDGVTRGSNFIQEYDGNYNSLGIIDLDNEKQDSKYIKTITTQNRTHYIGIRFGIKGLGGRAVYSNIQLEELSSSSSYEPYKSNEYVFNLKEPLRSLPEGISDKIVKKDCSWYIERRCKEEVFDGSRVPTGIYTEGTNSNYTTVYFDSMIYQDNLKVVSDKFIEIPFSEVRSLGKIEGVLGGTGTGGGIFFSIHNSRLADGSVASARDWFLANPTKVVYELREPIYEKITIPSIITYLETTYIKNKSNIPSFMSLTIDRTANKAIDAINIAKADSTRENIEQARFWVNLMKESIFKDDFQNKLNNILVPMETPIEKKVASVNGDVYIKMKNVLSLSLDTNKIVFEDVDLTENNEKKSAINLTVNSSIPYSVKASLETEIYNADKSDKLDTSILNIKNSSDLNYLVFRDIGVPLLLLDEQAAGENNIHSIDLCLNTSNIKKADSYKTSLKFEVEQK